MLEEGKVKATLRGVVLKVNCEEVKGKAAFLGRCWEGKETHSEV